MRVAGIAKAMDGYVTRLDYACANGLPRPGTAGGLPTYSQAFGCELGTEGGQSYTTGRLSLRWDPSDKLSVDVAASIVNDDSEAQAGVLVAAKDNSGSNFPWLSPNGPVPFPPFASDVPNNPTFNPNAGGTIPVFFDNNGNGTYQVGIDVPYDSRFVTGGTYNSYASYINDGSGAPSPLFQGGTPGANSDLFKPYVMEPVNTFESWDTSVNVNWQISDGGGATLTPRLDVSYQDEIYGNAVNAPTNFIDAVTLTNARLTWESADEAWQAALEVTNLTDEYYYVTLFDLWGPAGYIHGQPSRPREWALTIRRTF